MKCTNCGKENRPGMLFCIECGARLSDEKMYQDYNVYLEELQRESDRLEQEREKLLSQLLPERREA